MNTAIATIVAAVIGAVVGVLGTFWFQKKLFRQQLDFQERSQKQLHDFIQPLHSTFLGTIEKLEHRLSRIADRLPGGLLQISITPIKEGATNKNPKAKRNRTQIVFMI